MDDRPAAETHYSKPSTDPGHGHRPVVVVPASTSERCQLSYQWRGVAQFADQVDNDGRRLVVRNGYQAERDAVTAAGAVTVKAPRVNDREVGPETGERQRFFSKILPAWARKSPQVSEVLPLLYLHGLSNGDFGPPLEQSMSKRG